MTSTNRRAFIGGLAVAAGTLVTARAQAAGVDGHAAGYDVAPRAKIGLKNANIRMVSRVC